MNDLLGALVERTLGARDGVRPRLASTFERPRSESVAPARPRLEAVGVEAPAIAHPPEQPAPKHRSAGPRERAPSRAREVRPATPARPIAAAPRGGAVEHRDGAAEPEASAPEGDEEHARAAPFVPPQPTAALAPALEPSLESADVTEAEAESREPQDLREPAPILEAGDAPAPSAPRLVETRVVERDREARRGPLEREPAVAARSERPLVGPDAVEEPADDPIVHVHIGRIEVRGPAPPEPRPRAPRPREPLLSLDEYLEQGARGRR